MPLKPRERVTLQKSIWTSVIDAFRPSTLPILPRDMISKELTNTTENQDLNRILMAGKVRCKVCHRKLKSTFDANSCKRLDCPLEKKEQFQILTFKEWKQPKFKIIEDFECEHTPDEYEWPYANHCVGWDMC